ncbi:MAG TPA: hypothetical protein ENH10_03840 [Bacteroidetes bacterium]|nr:hypothetical protein BMS3Bbin04_00332 [bacterium BMS3Bbin04]HDO65149.1 hypothetical protein [Bacteroidota bacterium]HEX04274.1 hypothetical protein [Bacteroidota bacterium]
MSKNSILRIILLSVIVVSIVVLAGCEERPSSVEPTSESTDTGFPVTIFSSPERTRDAVDAFRTATDIAYQSGENEVVPYAADVVYIRNNPEAARNYVLSMGENYQYPPVIVGPTSTSEASAILNLPKASDILMLSQYPLAAGLRSDDNLLCFAPTPEHELSALYSNMQGGLVDWGATIFPVMPSDYQYMTEYLDATEPYRYRSHLLSYWEPFVFAPGNVQTALAEFDDDMHDQYGLGHVYLLFVGASQHAGDLVELLETIDDYEYLDRVDIIASSAFAGSETLLHSRIALSEMEERDFYSIRPAIDPYGGTGEYYNRLERSIHRPASYQAHITHDIHMLLTGALATFDDNSLGPEDVEILKARIIELSQETNGITGPLSLNETGDRTVIPYEIMEVHDGAWEVVGQSLGELFE